MTTNNIQTNFDKLQYQRKIKTLTHVLKLFEEKNKHMSLNTNKQLPIKANGAIVVNRPHKRAVSVCSLPNQYEEEELEEQEEQEEQKKDKDTADLDVSPIIKIEMDLVHQENKKLRQQILIEREQHVNWRITQEQLLQELSFAQNTIKNLQRMNDRFQKLILPKEKRRQSTGTTVNESQVIPSYERKIQILLNEIDAMENQENKTLNNLTIQKTKFEKLARKLQYKDEIIRQLSYDLKFERSHF